MRKKKDWQQIFSLIQRNQDALMAEYSETELVIPETSKWDYAIPENYTNYQDGFLWNNFDNYRGAPIIDFHGTILYLRWEVPFFVLKDFEKEKYLCFDRTGKKYTVTITEAPMNSGNPSYFRFLPRVKKYIPKRCRKEETSCQKPSA